MKSSQTFDESTWKKRLRESGLRATSARLDVIRALAASKTPQAAHDVSAVLATESPGAADRVTVYRTLNSLVEAGLANRVDPGDRIWRYELSGAEDHRHAHLVCDECGTVRCLDDGMITVSMKPKGTRDRFKVQQQDVYLHGTCEECLDDAAPPPDEDPQRGKPRKHE